MNADWPRKKISEIATHSLGKMLDKAKNKGELRPYLRNLNVRWFGFDLSDVLEMRFLPEDVAKCTAVKGDVLVCEGGYPGRAAIWEQDAPIYFQKALHRVRFHEPERSKWFLYYLHAKDLDGTLRNHFNGSGIQHFTGEALAQLEVPLPPIPEQQRIVGILDEAFKSIDTGKANAGRNFQNARVLFEGHLQSVFTERRKEWRREVPLSSVLSVQPRNGWSPPAEFHTGSGVPVLTLSSVTGFEYNGSRVKMSSAPTREGAHYWLQEGELLITRSNTQALVGHVAIYDGNPTKCICCDLIMKMKVDPSKALTRFIYFYLRAPESRAYLTSRAQGASSTMKKIGKQVVQGIPVPTPPLPEQHEVVSTLDALQAETQRLATIYERKLTAFDDLKRSLLHKAFEGKL
jgi:type I restriction enzyme S subunit